MLYKILEIIFLTANNAFAQDRVGSQPKGFKLPNPLRHQTISALLNSIGEFAFGLAISLASLLIIYAAYQILTAGGNPEQFEKGKKTILYTVIGLVVIFLSAVIINTIKELLGVQAN